MTRRRGPYRRLAYSGAVGVLADVRFHALHDREATLLDALRDRGPLSLEQLAEVLGHRCRESTSPYVVNLFEAGLIERRGPKCGAGRTFAVTDHGRSVA